MGPLKQIGDKKMDKELIKIKKELNSGVYKSEVVLKFVKEWLDEDIKSSGLGLEAKENSKFLKYWILEWESVIEKLDYNRANWKN